MKDKQYFLSLVIAAYNIEAYLSDCLESILSAGCENLEILLVIGNSKDATNEICNRYEKQYPEQIHSILQNGKGLSNARNCGIKIAKGKYVTFIDGDDRVNTIKFLSFLSFLKGLDENKKFDVLGNDFYMIDKKGAILQEKRQIKVKENRAVDVSYTLKLVKSQGTFWNAWRYVYKRDYLCDKKRVFMENRNCEDLEFTCRTFFETDKILFCHMPYYEYCPVREGSLTNAKTVKMVQDFLNIENKLKKLCKSKKGTLSEAIYEKLKELLILSLPDIYEVSTDNRKQCLLWYQKALKETDMPQRKILKIAFLIGRSQGLKLFAYFLWKLKYVRRNLIYRKREKEL